MVGVKGFEPPAPCSQSTYATKLRYTPLDPVAVTAVGFAPDDEIYLTIPASICQHLFSIFPKKLLSLSSSLRSAPWLPCVRGAVRRRAGLKGCPMGRGARGRAKPFSNLRTEPALRAAPVFRSAYSAPTAHCAVSSETLMLQVRFAHPPMPHRTSSSSCAGVSLGLFGKPKRSTSRFASLTLRCRTEPALQAAPVFRSAYSANRNARTPAASRSSWEPHCAFSSKTLMLQVRFARPPNPSRPAAAPINRTRQNRVKPTPGGVGGGRSRPRLG